MPSETLQLKRGTLPVFLAIAFLAGFLCGGAFAIYKMPDVVEKTAPNQQTISNQQQEAIAHLESKVKATPDDYQAWAQLANLYFDTSRYDQAVTAYERTLALHEGSADIWTDLGVMYRRTEKPRKAITAFDKALTINPRHQTALFNKGIVLFYDLHDQAAAVLTWKKLLTINPDITIANGTPLSTVVAQIEEQNQE